MTTNKKILVIIILPFLCSFYPQKNQSEIISLEAKYTCRCLEIVNKKAIRLEKKVERREKKTYKVGGKDKPLFGGYALDFNLDDCRNRKRNRKAKEYINSLSEEGKMEFESKVLREAKKKCPIIYKRIMN